jgi:hypothetical protein
MDLNRRDQLMKKIILAAFAASSMLAVPAFAAANPDSNGVNKNCFGKGRSDYASGDQPAGSVGSIISERAKTESTSPDYPNSNVQQNKEYKAACQAAPAP